MTRSLRVVIRRLPLFVASLVPVLLLSGACDRGPEAPPVAPVEGEATAVGPQSEALNEVGDDEVAEPMVDEAVAAEAAPRVSQVRVRPRGARTAPGRPAILFTAQVIGADGETLAIPVTWHSLDSARVAIDADGALTAVGPLGPAFITASAGDTIAEPVPVYIVDPADLSEEGEGDDEANGADRAEGAAAPLDGRPPQAGVDRKDELR